MLCRSCSASEIRKGKIDCVLLAQAFHEVFQDGLALFGCGLRKMFGKDFLEGLLSLRAHLCLACSQTCGEVGLGEKLSVEIAVAHGEKMKNENEELVGHLARYAERLHAVADVVEFGRSGFLKEW